MGVKLTHSIEMLHIKSNSIIELIELRVQLVDLKSFLILER